MPIHKVEGGWKWGEHGHVYPTREGAEKQAAAAHAHGYKGDVDSELPPRKGGEPRPDGDQEFITIEPKEGEFLTLPIHDEAEDSRPDTEYDIARKIQSEELSSPQSFQNIDLYDMRITGTGTSFRPKNNEHVYRPPENFLTDDFVNRCNGLPVIFEHPAGTLGTEEYRDRAIGTIILPYIKGDEVRGIARIYDKDASELMRTTHSSTSPAVVFGPKDGNQVLDIGDGSHLLIEGIPSYLDHLAICPEGVWDKGKEPNGINLSGENTMPEVEKDKKDEAGEQAPAWMDKFDKKLDSLHDRLDRLEKKDSRKDESEEEKEHKEEGEDIKELDEAHKEEDEAEEDEKDKKDKKDKKDRYDESDSEKGREEEKKEDSRMDSVMKENSLLRDRIAAMESKVGRIATEPTADQREVMAKAQARADSVGSALGFQVTGPMAGETAIGYRKRLVGKVLPFIKNESLKKLRYDSMDEGSFSGFEELVYTAVADSVNDPNIVAHTGGLYYQKTQMLGREVLVPRGDSGSFISRHTSPGYLIKGGFKTDSSKR